MAARLTGIADTSNWLSEGQDGRPVPRCAMCYCGVVTDVRCLEGRASNAIPFFDIGKRARPRPVNELRNAQPRGAAPPARPAPRAPEAPRGPRPAPLRGAPLLRAPSLNGKSVRCPIQLPPRASVFAAAVSGQVSRQQRHRIADAVSGESTEDRAAARIKSFILAARARLEPAGDARVQAVAAKRSALAR